MIKLATLLCLLYLAACSTTKSENTFTPLLAGPEQAVIYLYRPAEMSNAIYSPDLYINDEFKLAIKNGTKSRLLLVPGVNKLELEPGGKYTGLTSLSINLPAGSTRYIRLDTSLKVKNSVGYEPYERNFYLVKVDEKIAIDEIAECCATKDKTAPESLEPQTTIQEPDDGFSVDKTQNPFSN